MARTYKRDSRGRFASGGSSTGSSKGKPLKRGRAQLAEARRKVRTAKSKLAAIDPADQTIKSSLSKRAQRGAVTKAEKRLAAVKRTAVIKGRRMTGTIAKPKGLKPGALKGKGVAVKARANTSAAAFSRRLQRTDPAVAAQRRMQSEMARPMQFSGHKPGGAADRRFRDQVSTASYNRQRRSEGVAREARKLLSLASQSPSDWATRPRYSTVKKPSKSNPAWSYSDLSAWGRTSRRRR